MKDFLKRFERIQEAKPSRFEGSKICRITRIKKVIRRLKND
jgi:hypothetical protein